MGKGIRTYTVGASGFQRTSQVVALLSLFPQVWHVGAARHTARSSDERTRIHRADENRFVTLSRLQLRTTLYLVSTSSRAVIQRRAHTHAHWPITANTHAL